MTSASVFNCNSVNQSQTLNAGATADKAKAGNLKETFVFSSLMNADYSTPKTNTASNQMLSGDGKKENTADTFESYQYRDNRIDKASVQTVSDKIDENSDKLDGFQKDVIQAVAKELDVDEEQLTEAMEALGLTAFDLLNPMNLAQLVMQVTGGDSPMELLADSGFLDLMQVVSGLGENLSAELELKPGQMDELIAQMDQLENPVSPEEMPVMETEAVHTEAAAENEEALGTVRTEAQMMSEDADDSAALQSQKTMAEESDQSVQIRQTGNTDASKNSPENMAGNQQEEKEPDGADAFLKKSFEPARETEGHTPVETFFTVEKTVVQEAVPEMPVNNNSYLSVNAMDLIEQIAENVKVGISEGTASMEMQLNPENLGKIYLQVTDKQGTIHAMLAAQNEAVRAALETQVADLRESLNQAGIKVDAVEVTIASHEFEKNLEQNQEQQKQQGERQQNQASGRKNLNFLSPEDAMEELTQEEALAAQMMRDNGNSVDMTA